MTSGFRFKGKHSNDMGVGWLTTKRPFLPNQKIVSQEALNMHGDYDFDNEKVYYQNRIFEGEITICKDNMKDLNKRLSEISRWLNHGYGELIFDDMPNNVWIARIENHENLRFNLSSVGVFTVMFKVKPFSTANYKHKITKKRIGDNEFVFENIEGESEYKAYREYSGVRNPLLAYNERFNILKFPDEISPILYMAGSYNDVTIDIGYYKTNSITLEEKFLRIKNIDIRQPVVFEFESMTFYQKEDGKNTFSISDGDIEIINNFDISNLDNNYVLGFNIEAYRDDNENTSNCKFALDLNPRMLRGLYYD